MIKDWDQMSFQDKLGAFPDRHPFVVKCLLGLLFGRASQAPVRSSLEAILPRMGYELIRTEIDIGGGAFLVTDNWVQSPEFVVEKD